MTKQTNPDDFSQRVARRIKELRLGGNEKLTQEELAYRANMDTTSFSRIERGQNPDVRLMTLDP
ncbi:helix-turn-helix domain-containing protein [Streptococcus thoraltensis]|uniref:helix-turn-helix domain-containing protein n=1 Tax=Streptococcus thoraltensis TaxID=55085 RepID=UPI001F58B810|nr:helix-turn-helix transcriptional regulator [Streptococcus thoraltensis]